jgi:hypothetical protein
LDIGRLECNTTFNLDGTFRAVATLKSLKEGPAGVGLREISTGFLDVRGTWLVQDGFLIMKILKTEKPRDCPEEEARVLLAVLGPRLQNLTTSEQIVSVSDTHLITKDSETGRQSVAERVR